MQRTDIEWVVNPDGSPGYTCNPVKGFCPVACPYCYARRMYLRFKWDKTIRFHASEIEEISTLKKSSTIFMGSTIELFGEWVNFRWLGIIFQWVRLYPQHTFIFLSKCYQNLVKYRAFPKNCYIGLTATDAISFRAAINCLNHINAKVKFLSIEPFIEPFPILPSDIENVNWLIIGGMTIPKAEIANDYMCHLIEKNELLTFPYRSSLWRVLPTADMIRSVISIADGMNVPVFIKDNILDGNPLDLRLAEMRQELPGGVQLKRKEEEVARKKRSHSKRRKPKTKRTSNRRQT